MLIIRTRTIMEFTVVLMICLIGGRSSFAATLQMVKEGLLEQPEAWSLFSTTFVFFGDQNHNDPETFFRASNVSLLKL